MNSKDLPYVLLARASTKMQESSLDTQAARGKAWSDYTGKPLLIDRKKYFALESGAKKNRNSVEAAIMALKRKEIAGIVITRLDRLGRSVEEICRITREIISVGGELICIEQPIDTTTPQGRAFLQMMGVFAELERAFLQERIQEAIDAAKEEGKHILGSRAIPYGFRVDEKRNLLLDEYEQKIIQKIFRWTREGKSQRQIAFSLNKSKTPTKRGGKWSQTHIARLLASNPAPPIIYEELTEVDLEILLAESEEDDTLVA